MRPTPSRCDGSIDATAARAPKFKHVCHGLPRKWSKKRHVGVERTQVWRTCDQTSLVPGIARARRQIASGSHSFNSQFQKGQDSLFSDSGY